MSDLPAPELTAPDGWNAIDSVTSRAPISFVSGDPQEDRLRVRYFVNQAGTACMARVWFGAGAQGPPGHAHGGAVAAVLDEAMGTASWCLGHPGLAASLTVEFLEMVPLGTVATVDAWIEGVKGRKVSLASRLSAADGEVLATARALFVELPPGRFERFVEEARRARG